MPTWHSLLYLNKNLQVVLLWKPFNSPVPQAWINTDDAKYHLLTLQGTRWPQQGKHPSLFCVLYLVYLPGAHVWNTYSPAGGVLWEALEPLGFEPSWLGQDRRSSFVLCFTHSCPPPHEQPPPLSPTTNPPYQDGVQPLWNMSPN